jgi:hypothetical protein
MLTSPEERAAYQRVHAALGRLGRLVQEELGGAEYQVRLTSGFRLKKRSPRRDPQGLWFAVYRRQNAKESMANHTKSWTQSEDFPSLRRSIENQKLPTRLIPAT